MNERRNDFPDRGFGQRGNLAKAYERFGDRLGSIVAEMSRVLKA